MSLICLLGRHGSGKSTIGAELASRGFRHTSVGMLRRLAQAAQFPSDVPAALMMAMRRERAGTALSTATAKKLVDHAQRVPDAILDGFPSCEAHLDLLPPDAVFCLVWTPARIRLQRLERRSEVTKRVWTPGLHSEREATLPGLILAIRRTRRCTFIPNGSTPADAANRILVNLSST